MAYTLDNLEDLSRQFTRIGQDSSMYSKVKLHNALMLAAEEWVRLVKPSRTLSTLTLTAGTNNLGTLPTGWTPRQHIRADLVLSGSVIMPDLHFTTYDEVQRQSYMAGGTTAPRGIPRYFGIKNGTDSICTPTPDAAYQVYLYWWNPAPTWTAGGTASGLDVIPDEQWRVICTDGVSAKLQDKEPENRTIAAEAYARFKEKMWEFRGQDVGGRDGQVVYKSDPGWDYNETRQILV